MTMTASATTEVAATPQEVLEFVLDLHRYKEVDPKIVRVVSLDGPDEEGRGSVKMWARMWWLPPAPDRQDFVLERWNRLTFTGAPRQPARMLFDFVGTVECDESDTGARLTHAYEFRFKGPFRRVERVLGSWLQRQIEEEVEAIAGRFRFPNRWERHSPVTSDPS